ncbi:GGDEF domain-containing protein [Desulfitobacterium metallireducens]|uniref:GGDEF domain-containing protein n=1 Tax=Desulfitobacterium metallireducens TaxID=142877 RepID=UPI000231323F|nr:GGDEF domain-containing protein [Desulfitobacterium metallireducens]
MKRWFRTGIQLAPLILPLLGVGLGIIGYLLNHYVPREYEFKAWVGVILILIINGILLGQVLKSLALNATMDPLTGLGNKGLFYYFLKYQIQKCKKGTQLKEPNYLFSLAMIDIDNFKALNDTYGHLAGDSVLKNIARIFERNVRSSDAIIRWGGEEFAIVLPGTEDEGALVFLERIREIIANYNFGPEVQSQKVTVSVGVVSSRNLEHIKDENEIIDDIVQRADQALYHAKKTKNCVVGYELILKSDQS